MPERAAGEGAGVVVVAGVKGTGTAAGLELPFGDGGGAGVGGSWGTVGSIGGEGAGTAGILAEGTKDSRLALVVFCFDLVCRKGKVVDFNFVDETIIRNTFGAVVVSDTNKERLAISTDIG